MNNNWIYLIPIIGTITGWLINSLIIRVMLYPANPVKIGGLTFQGFLFKKLQISVLMKLEIVQQV